jgi:hypothetical protein
MNPTLRRAFPLLALVFFAPALAAPTPTQGHEPLRLSRLMSEHAYQSAGLARLTPAERRALEGWIDQHLRTLVLAARRAHTAARFGLPRHVFRHMPSRIVSHLVGVFTGWSGRTRFRLRNGEIWIQDGYGSFTTPPLRDPRVVIKKLLVGYVLRVPPYGAQVFVRRVH